MTLNLPLTQPSSENELLERSLSIAGLNFAQLAYWTQLTIPLLPNHRKGWAGCAIERALGATSGNRAQPDFNHLGIELKTIPVIEHNKPVESTFVTSIPLLTVHQQHWHTSSCYQKLKRVLWIPIEATKDTPFEQRRIGKACLWSPTASEIRVLSNDWLALSSMIGHGQLEEIDASMGDYLQVRPKCANARALCYGFNSQGQKILTLPRGFYLRSVFTQTLLK